MAGRFNRIAQNLRWLAFLVLVGIAAPLFVVAAPYADYVIDARTGEVLHSQNADTRLYPASLTKMMTLYITFDAIRRGEISLDTEITVTADASREPPSKLGLRTGQRIKLRYLIRAAAVKSANDAATAIAVGLEGSVPNFAARMNRTAAAMGMTNTSFRNANGLTASGHMSTAHDMTILGRHLLYDFPDYYNLFSRRTADAGMAQVRNTNSRFLDSYSGADGIKTGYTDAAGYNIVASAERGGVRIIATVFGGTSTANRNARVSQLLNNAFGQAPRNAAFRAPAPLDYSRAQASGSSTAATTQSGAGKTVRVNGVLLTSVRPPQRPGSGGAPETVVASASVDAVDMDAAIAAALAAATVVTANIDNSPEDDSLAGPEIKLPPPASPAADEGDDEGGASEVMAAAEPAPEPETAFILADVATMGMSQNDTPPPVDDLETAALMVPPNVVAALIPPTAPVVEPVEQVVAVSAPLIELSPEPPVLAQDTSALVTRVSTSGGLAYGISVGRYGSSYEAERALLVVALSDSAALVGAERKIVESRGRYDATFVGMTQEMAELACRRLQARGTSCSLIGGNNG